MVHATADGFSVFLVEVRISRLQAGMIEGRREGRLLQRHLDELSDRCAKRFQVQGAAVVLAPADNGHQWQVELHFRCRDGAHTKDSDFASEIAVACFVDTIDQTVEDIAKRVASEIDWRRSAHDYDITFV